MTDATTTLAMLKKIKEQFVTERDWNQFHTPKKLSMALSVEASELMELFIWCTSKESFEVAKTKKNEFQNELADIMMYCIALANATHTDIAQAIEKKVSLNKQKYPVNLCKGKSDKYTQYQKLKN